MAAKTDAEVVVLESGLVAPSEPTPTHTLWLSNLDIQNRRAYTTTFYYYKPNSEPSFFSPELLKSALSKTLVPFYPFAGRLELDEDRRPQINCAGEGVLFIVTRTEARAEDLGNFTPSDKLRRLLVPSLDGNVIPSILFAFQLTFLKCGGVCLGVASHHTAWDGFSALHFINTWSDIARGFSNPITSPFLDRTLLRARSPPTVDFDHIEYALGVAMKPPPSETTVLNLSESQILLLKNSFSSNGRPTTTFNAVIGHVWRSSCKARGLGKDRDTRLFISADARARVVPPLPPGYLGNANFLMSVPAKAGEITENAGSFTAEKIRDSTARLTDDYVRSLVDFFEVHEHGRLLASGWWLTEKTDLLVVSWLRMPLYDTDFGWGRPSFMGRTTVALPGLVYIMRRVDGEGGVMVVMSLETEFMDEFKKIFYQEIGGEQAQG